MPDQTPDGVAATAMVQQIPVAARFDRKIPWLFSDPTDIVRTDADGAGVQPSAGSSAVSWGTPIPANVPWLA